MGDERRGVGEEITQQGVDDVGVGIFSFQSTALERLSTPTYVSRSWIDGVDDVGLGWSTGAVQGAPGTQRAKLAQWA